MRKPNYLIESVQELCAEDMNACVEKHLDKEMCEDASDTGNLKSKNRRLPPIKKKENSRRTRS